MSWELWLTFVLTSSGLLIIPGPTILTVISYALKHGPTATPRLVLAVASGDAVAASISLLGLGALLATSAFLFSLVKLIGGLYLIYLGLHFLFSKSLTGQTKNDTSTLNTNPDKANATITSDSIFINTFLVTALNPKGIVFFVAFLPQFIDPTSSTGPQLIILATTFVALGAINAAFYACIANRANRKLTAKRIQRKLNLASGGLLTFAGVWTLTSEKI